jgi:DNA polymerase III delta prime subunit
MDTFQKLFPQNLYHSYVVEGDPEATGNLLLEFLKVRKEIEEESPDVLFQIYESFSMDSASGIKNWHSKKGIGKGKKICIIATKFINREAEQTLLKIIEEPTNNTHIFIVIPDSSVLLSTILSRVHVVKTKQQSDKDLQKLAATFVLSSTKVRIDEVAKIIKENKDEESSGQLRFYATTFVNELENIFYQKFKKNRTDKKTQFILSELQKARGYLSTPGAAVKMILEHLALMI